MRKDEFPIVDLYTKSMISDALGELRDELQAEADRQSQITTVEGLNIAINRINAKIRKYTGVQADE